MASINLQGDTSGSISISAPSVAGSNTLTLPATTQTLATQNALGVRNLIINGDMQIAQRGTSSTSTGYYTVDRWFSGDPSASNTITQSQEADAPSNQGLYYSHKNLLTSTSTATGARLESVQRLEAQFIRHSGWNYTSSSSYLTLSFWVKSNVTGTYYTVIRTEDGTAKSINKSYTISSADTWEKKTITISGDSSLQIDNDNGRGMSIWIFYIANTDTTDDALSNLDAWGTFSSSGYTPDSSTASTFLNTSGAYISVTGVQLEVGDTATPFEHRPYDMELARCQRYYEKSYDIGTVPGTATQNGNLSTVTSGNSSNQMAGVRFKVRKRAVPTCTAYNAVSGASGGCYRYNDGANIGLTFNGVGETAAGRATLASNSDNTYLWHFVATAEL